MRRAVTVTANPLALMRVAQAYEEVADALAAIGYCEEAAVEREKAERYAMLYFPYPAVNRGPFQWQQ